MTTHYIIQGFGYLATLLLALSLLVTNDLKFRWLNAFGCVAFIVYGVLLKAFPIILTNALLLAINVYYLIKIYHRREDFDLIPFSSNDPLIEKFLSFYKDDIQSYFPNFSSNDLQHEIRFMVLRDMNIANVFVASRTPEGDGLVHLNYTIPKYRDFKVGCYIFDKEKAALTAKGLKRIVYHRVHNKAHAHFLRVTEFTQQNDGSYVKELV